ncbi:hypothetical protein RM780_02960 [Streptomyces sp. DSM 44917]|uniref:DUF2267 domain-containing protein n=1 Tax=Streptomyces boetiae TaxID=3075541 RepID=A0ABU2L333_9ACTN|nr:hypothetical protein [Streptomyces sp. DSM 44917]MDT0305922.1 hypothetical protein [Streptomyces sp. DSM 44917]
MAYQEQPDGGDAADREAQTDIYLRALRSRLGPKAFEAVVRAALEILAAASREQERVDIDLPDDLRDEWLMLMAVLGSGRMDMRRLEIPGEEGGGWAMVTAEAAEDPAVRARLRDFFAERHRQRAAERETLEGIARASGMMPD